MDIDEPSVAASATSTAAAPPPAPRASSTNVAGDALSIFRDALSPFITASVRRALGEDMYTFYLPRPNAHLGELLKYVVDKWQNIFSDTPLDPFRPTVERLVETAYANRRALNPLPKRDADAVVKDVQSLLIAMRKPGLAAKVAALAEPPRATATVKPASSPRRPDPVSVHRVQRGAQTAAHAPQEMDVAHLLAPSPSHAQAFGDVSAVPVSAAVFSPPAPSSKVPIALDGSNIAWRHGVSARFSIRGVAEALAYFTMRGHPTVVFLPEGRLRSAPRAPVGGSLPEGEEAAYAALKELEGSAMLVLTPEKDYDDCYFTHFAREYQAVVVSNDRFEDQIYQASADGEEEKEGWRRWIQACRLPFTFHQHTFVPNPAFSMERAREVARELCRPAAPRG